jgi:pimeloyl-ACP methyl ester carboxylesterase
MVHDPGAPPKLPQGRHLELPGRGLTFVREVTGPPGAPVVVLLHGWTATAALNWFPSFAPLGRHFRVVALDHRGHGQGIRSRQPFRLEDCADDVAALAEQLGITKLIPVGYSMGGPIATLTWLRHRDLVQGLVLCATAARFVGSRPTHRMFAQGMLGLSLAASLSPEALRHRAMVRFVNNRLDGTDLSGWAGEELARNDPAALLRAGAALGAFDSRSWLPNIDVATAVVVTEDDRIVLPVNQLALAGAIPGAEVFGVAGDHAVCVADAAHFVPVLLKACRMVARRPPTAAAAAAAPVTPVPTTPPPTT